MAPPTDRLVRPVAVVGGLRTPFCRSGGGYASLSNKALLTTVLRAMVERFELTGVRLGEVNAGAVISHSRDWNLAREAVLSTGLDPRTPATTMQQACGTSLQAAMTAAAKIATGSIDVAIAAGTDTVSDVPIVFRDRFARRLVALGKARSAAARLKVFKGFSPRELAPLPPATDEPRTLLSMGQHCELMAKRWGIDRQAQDELALASHASAANAWRDGFFDRLVVPCEGVLRDDNVRPDASMETLGKLRPAYDKTGTGTLTAGNSTPLTDGASGVLLCSEEWAKERGLPVQAWLTHCTASGIDFVGGEGLLMAPVLAVSDLLRRADLSLQDIDLYEIHEAFAAQVLCTLAAWQDVTYCREHLDRDTPLGAIDRSRLNVAGSSLAIGHPFAATGARVTATLATLLVQRDARRGLISVCTAGGMGLAALLER